ncbi:RNA-directed DNA polymerase, eukaryota, reverse transcriptase zinc-binding domain protein [Tanacetum coccineum]
MLEAVASHYLWIWHAFVEVAGANNDINVLDNSPLFDDLLDDKAPVAPYVINGVGFEKEYYLADASHYPSLLCFADGLLVLCHGEVQSVKTIKKALEKFSVVSGLQPNMGKSTMFCGSLTDETKDEIQSILPFKVGKLLVKYLGVPLVSKKIRVPDCKVLIDKVNQKLGDWENKNLTYAGRAQLIASVLSSMHVYWGSVFLLPKTVINDIERIFKRFLWSSGDNSKGRAKIAWFDVCMPKDQGRNVWDVDIQKNESWGWKSILGLREIHKKEIFYAGFSDNNNVADLIDTNGWKWPAKWKEKYRFLNNIPIPQLTNNPNTHIWISNDGKEGKFSTNKIINSVLKTSLLSGIQTTPTVAAYAKKRETLMITCFFNCDYALELWEKVKDKSKICVFATNWKDIVIEISKWKSKWSVWGTIRKRCFVAAVYYLWQERNRRTFGNVERSSVELLNILEEEVRNIMLSIIVKQSYVVQQAEEQWKVKFMKQQ